MGKVRTGHGREGRNPEIDDLDRVVTGGVPVVADMRVVESLHDFLNIALFQLARCGHYLQFIALAYVPGVRGANERHVIRCDAFAGHLLHRLRFQLLVPGRDLGRRQFAARLEHGLREVVPQVGHQQAEGRGDAGSDGDEDGRDVHLVGKL